MQRIVHLLLLIIAQRAELLAQRDTVQLNAALIYAERKWLFASGHYVETADSALKKFFGQQMISEWPLSSSLTLKNYGPGGIATASMRGLEARHTSVIWNGIPLNSPSLGLTDLSILPVSPYADITVFHGNASSLYHTTASGSALIIEEKNRFDTCICFHAGMEAGSFGNRKYATGLQVSGPKFYQGLSLNMHQAENNFPFINSALPDSPKQKQQHASENHRFIQGQTGWKISGKEELTFSWRYQDSERELPPMMTQARNDAELKDSLLNAVIHFKKITGSKSSVFLKTALLANNQQYSDTVARIYSANEMLTQFYEAGVTFAFSPYLTAQAGSVYSTTRFDFTDYDHRKRIEDYSGFTSLRFEKNQLQASLHLRKTWRARTSSLMHLSAGMEYRLSHRVLLRAAAGSSYQLPTGNDLYWKPGGNPELKPEKSRSIEAGSDFSFSPSFRFSITAYRNEVSDWIQWVPVTSGFYSPQNLKKVRADGVESAFAIPFTLQQWKIKLTGSYTLSHSVNRSTGQTLSADVLNKQLIYIPKHAANGSLTVSFRTLTFWLYYHYNGLRYTTADHSYYLPAQHLFQCAVMYRHSIKKIQLQPYFRIANLTDSAYQSMAWRPMQGRSFHFGLSVSFHQPSSNN
jgi:iron complex outermembrane receptor protein